MFAEHDPVDDELGELIWNEYATSCAIYARQGGPDAVISTRNLDGSRTDDRDGAVDLAMLR